MTAEAIMTVGPHGSLIKHLAIEGSSVPNVGELKVCVWDPTAGFRQKAMSYVIVTVFGNAIHANKSALLDFAKTYNISVADKTYGK